MPKLNRRHKTFRNKTIRGTEAHYPTPAFAMLGILDSNLKAIKNKLEENMSNISKIIISK